MSVNERLRLTVVANSTQPVLNGGVPGGGEPPYDGGMEFVERVVRVEEKLSGVDKRLELVEKDLRALGAKLDSHFLALGGMIVAVALGLAGLMAKGFHWF